MDGMTALLSAYEAEREKLLHLEGVEGETARPVFGEGPLHPAAMLIGEAPGAEETEAGRPFVGRAGKNLSAFLESVGLKREELFVTNAVKYRPYRIGKSGRKANRPPKRKELEEGRVLLFEEISIVQPALIVTLGNSPLWALTGENAVGTLHGTVTECKAGKLFSLYHPASLIYNRALAPVYQKDMEVLAALLAQIRAKGPHF